MMPAGGGEGEMGVSEVELSRALNLTAMHQQRQYTYCTHNLQHLIMCNRCILLVQGFLAMEN